MKNFIRYSFFPLFIFISHPLPIFADEVDTMIVTGYSEFTSSSGTISFGSLGQQGGPGIQFNPSGRGDAIKERLKQKCNNDADAAGKQCSGAYNQLNSICTGLVGYYGGVASSKFFERIVGAKLDDGVKFAIATSGGVVNQNAELLSCSALTSKAMDFCAAGVAKMKSACAK